MADSNLGSEESGDLSDKLMELSRKLQEMEEARKKQELDMARLQAELEEAKQQLANNNRPPTDAENIVQVLAVEPEPEFVLCEPQGDRVGEAENTELVISDDYPVTITSIKTEQEDYLTINDEQGENIFTNPTQDLLVVSKDGVTWYVCQKCKKAFTKQIFWRRHINRHYFMQYLKTQYRKANNKISHLNETRQRNPAELININTDSAMAKVKPATNLRCHRCGTSFRNKRCLLKHSYLEKHLCNKFVRLRKRYKNIKKKSVSKHLVKDASERRSTSTSETKVVDKGALFTYDPITENETTLGSDESSDNESQTVCKSEEEDPFVSFKPSGMTKRTRNRPRQSVACVFCGKVFRKKSDLTPHENYHLGLKPFPCKQCNKFFGSKSNLIKHERQVHSNTGPVLCEVCGLACSTRFTLKQHLQVHSEDKPYTCSECGKSFRRKANLQIHFVVHSEEKPFVCSFCGKRLSDKMTLRDHELRHQGVMPYKCDVCDQEFKNNCLYFNHKKMHREGIQNSHNFLKEGGKLKRKRNNKPKSREKNFTCVICNKSFLSNASLQAHDRIHTGERPFECEVCHRRFRQLATLKTHQINHQSVKPYTCSFCGKGFSLKSILRAHETTHTGERAFPCKHCEKSFKQLAHLVNHERIVHQGVRDCYCPTCGKAFTTKGNLRQHEKIHLPQEIVYCSICNKTFSNKYRLTSHMKLHSKEHSEMLLQSQMLCL